MKANVARAKLEMKKYIEGGGKPEDFLEYYHGELVRANAEWRESQAKLLEMTRSGDTDAAREYAESENRRLDQEGIRPLVIPQALQQK